MISPHDVKPSNENFEVIGTFNPGVIRSGNMTYLLVRVAEMPKEKRQGQIALPRAENGKLIVDRQKKDAYRVLDKRAVISKSSSFLRLTNISHLRLAKSRDGINIDSIDKNPTIFPEEPYEEFGIEDARITAIGDEFYITYVAVSSNGIVTALISTKDFIHFERHGILFTTENKDVVIFPEKIANDYVALHRPLSATPFGPPEIWMAYSPDLIHWGNHHCVIKANSFSRPAEIKDEKPSTSLSIRKRITNSNYMKIGAGMPPIKTNAGWLEIYHSSSKANDADSVGVYCMMAALFELNNPKKLIGVSKKPILVPETDYETLKKGSIYEHEGFLPNIVFSTGIVAEGNELLIYSGAADTYTAVTKLSLQDVLKAVE